MTVERYPHVTRVSTRWHDNDVYGHVNNVEYYAVFDTVINEFLIREGGLDIPRAGRRPLRRVAVRVHAAFAFPEVIVAGLGVSRLGLERATGSRCTSERATPAAEMWFVRIRRPRESSAGGDTNGRARRLERLRVGV
jgi:acyl-CoA thioester hydrolase